MASSLVDAKTENFTEEKNTGKTEVMSTSTAWKTNSSSTHTRTDHTLYLEDIQIQLLDENEKYQSTDGHGTPQEMKQYSSCQDQTDLSSKREDKACRRRVGVVELSDTFLSAKRMKARVIRKKFGEGMVSKMPQVFNKKL